MSPELEALVHPVELIAEIRARLVAAGGVRELQHLRGFSSSELAVLVHQEVFRGCASSDPQDPDAEVAA